MAENLEFTTQQDTTIIDLELSEVKKKFFRFDKDDNRMVELNIADMGVISRLAETYPKLEALVEEVQNVDIEEDDDIKSMKTIGSTLKDIDIKMRDCIDYIFNAPLSAAAAPDGTIYDIYNGQFRFEYILELMLSQYENNMIAEFKKMQKHTAKYTTQDHKKKKA